MLRILMLIILKRTRRHSVWPVFECFFRHIVRFAIVGVFRFFKVAKRNGGGCFEFGLTEGMRETGCRDAMM